MILSPQQPRHQPRNFNLNVGRADCKSKSVFRPTPRRRNIAVIRPSGRTARRTRFFCLPKDTPTLPKRTTEKRLPPQQILYNLLTPRRRLRYSKDPDPSPQKFRQSLYNLHQLYAKSPRWYHRIRCIGNEHTGWLSQSTSFRRHRCLRSHRSTPRKARDRGLTTHDTLESLLQSDIEIALISTPTAMHFDHTLEALSAGKHVMIEKPMAMDLNQARRMVQIADSANRVLSVFHNRRWDIDFLTVKYAIDSGTLGRVFNIESRLGQWAVA